MFRIWGVGISGFSKVLGSCQVTVMVMVAALAIVMATGIASE